MYYDSVCKVLTTVRKLTIPPNKFKCSQDYIVPGFNEHLKELHCDARAQYLIWRNVGKPRTVESHGKMRNSRLCFKYAFRQCRANKEMMRADALAHALCNRDSTSFWKDVRKMASSKIPLQPKLEMLLVMLILLLCGKLTFPSYSIVCMILAQRVLFVNMLMLYCLIIKV